MPPGSLIRNLPSKKAALGSPPEVEWRRPAGPGTSLTDPCVEEGL
jgi:hypothetical protein